MDMNQFVLTVRKVRLLGILEDFEERNTENDFHRTPVLKMLEEQFQTRIFGRVEFKAKTINQSFEYSDIIQAHEIAFYADKFEITNGYLLGNINFLNTDPGKIALLSFNNDFHKSQFKLDVALFKSDHEAKFYRLMAKHAVMKLP